MSIYLIRNTFRYILVSVIMLSLSSNLYPQKCKVCATKIKKGQIFSEQKELKEWLKRCSNDTLALFSCIAENYTDSLLADRVSPAMYMVKELSLSSKEKTVRGVAINLFLALSKSKDSGVSMLAVKSLKSFSADDFAAAAIDSVASIIEKYPSVYREMVELAGCIGHQSFISTIQRVFPSSRSFSKPERWATYKALARLGDKESLDYCIKRVSSLPLNDQVVEVLYRDLIYIHQKEAFDVLIKALYSDERLCSSSNPNSDGRIVCGYRIVELLAPVIKDFPVKVLTSGDLDTNDYKKTLEEVKAWFLEHGDSYTIISSF